MVGNLSSLEVNGMLIKKGTHAEIDIWGDGRVMDVTVLGITVNGYEAEIESITSYGSIIHHTDSQWEDMLVRVMN